MKIDQSILLKVADFIKKNRSIENINFLFSLGKYSKKFGFERDILHCSCYYKIQNFLNTCSTWDKIENKNGNEIESESEEESETETDVLDELIILCENGSYDIQLTAETYFTKSTKSYTKKNHVFNLSEIDTVLDECFYSFQLLAIIPKNYTELYISESSLLKIIDILKIINPSTEFTFLIV
jgi:hypothetical protein